MAINIQKLNEVAASAKAKTSDPKWLRAIDKAAAAILSGYLLHLDTPPRHARHYVGIADDLPARLERHASGQGARMLAVCVERGIIWQLVRTWQGGRKFERRLKKMLISMNCGSFLLYDETSSLSHTSSPYPL